MQVYHQMWPESENKALIHVFKSEGSGVFWFQYSLRSQVSKWEGSVHFQFMKVESAIENTCLETELIGDNLLAPRNYGHPIKCRNAVHCYNRSPVACSCCAACICI